MGDPLVQVLRCLRTLPPTAGSLEEAWHLGLPSTHAPAGDHANSCPCQSPPPAGLQIGAMQGQVQPGGAVVCAQGCLRRSKVCMKQKSP